jgi:ribosomal-protein-alanine N-acetyltransferase
MHAAAVRCRIRLMRAEDIAQVMDIERGSFPSMWPQTVYQRELKNKMSRYLVAYEPIDEEPVEAEVGDGPGVRGLVRRFLGGLPKQPDERVLGMVGLWCVMGEGHVVTIAVRPEYRRQGIGEVLLVAVLEAALEAGQDEVTLEYRISNQAARSLYDKYGFNQVGVRARYYSDNHEDAVLMTTPPLRSTAFRRLIAERLSELRKRWDGAEPLETPMLARITAGGAAVE